MLFENITYIDDNFESKTGSILVEDGKITWIGQGKPEGYSGKVYNGKNKFMIPGLYNIHCHVPMGLLRGYGEGLPLHRWLNEKVFPFEDKLDADSIYWGSLLGMAEMIKSGVVSHTDMYFHLPSIAKAADEIGIKVNLTNAAMAFSDDVKYMDTRAGKETKWLIENVNSFKHGRIVADAGLHAEYTCTQSLAREVAEFAKTHDLRMQVHISETFSEHDESKKRREGLTPLQFVSQNGLLDVPATLAHCVAVEDCDVEIMLQKNASIAHCPTSNLKLGCGVAKIWQHHLKGVNVGIGTDGAASNNNLNGLEETNLASIVQKGFNQDPLCMDAATTLKMATLNGAKSQGRKDCGTIKAGNRADLVVFDMNAPNLSPVFDALANVIYAGSSENICMTMVEGNILYENGEFKTIDIEKVMAECDKAQKHIISQL